MMENNRQESTDSESIGKNDQLTTALKLEMPSVPLEPEDFDTLAYHQNKFREELGSIQLLSTDPSLRLVNNNNMNNSICMPTDYHPSTLLSSSSSYHRHEQLQQQQQQQQHPDHYYGYPANHDSYLENDNRLRSPWIDSDYNSIDGGMDLSTQNRPGMFSHHSSDSTIMGYNVSSQSSISSRDIPDNNSNASNMSNNTSNLNLNAMNSQVKSKVITGTAYVTPQSRHARRLYVGGLTTTHCDDEALKSFLNSVICTALGDEPDSSYILSIYVNQQKCFAFIELNSIELTTACLELDGVLYQNNPLKILRANEYKPELLPPPAFPPIKLNLSGLLFGPTTNTHSLSSSSSSQGAASPIYSNIDPQVDQLIKYCSLNTVQRGSIVIIGFPYDDPLRRGVSGVIPISNVGTTGKPARGCAMAPRAIRTALRKFQCGPMFNTEYGVDLSQLKIFDIGDIQGGLSNQEAFKNLADIIAEVIQRGATPCVIGGSCEIAANIAAGLLLVASNPIGMVNVSASADSTPLEDSRFYNTRTNYGGKLHCEGRYIQFGAQGSATMQDQSRQIMERGGKIIWFNKDLRHRQLADLRDLNSQLQSPQLSPTSQSYGSFKGDIGHAFKQTLYGLNPDNITYTGALPRPVCVSFSMSSLSSAYFPGHSQLRSTGLSADEAMDIAISTGRDRNVVGFSINDFNVEVEENRSSRLVVDFLYSFFIGFASRMPSVLAPRSSTTSAVSSKTSTPRTSTLIPNTSRSSTPVQNVPSKLINTSVPHQAMSSPLAQPNHNGPGYIPPYADSYSHPNHMNNPRGGYPQGPLGPLHYNSGYNSSSPSSSLPGSYESNSYGVPLPYGGGGPGGGGGGAGGLGLGLGGGGGPLPIMPGGHIPGIPTQQPYPGFDSHGFPVPNSRTGSKGDSPTSYQSGYTSASMHTNSRPGSKNESPTTTSHPMNSSNQYPVYY